ncbi:3-isopropylmalate dehydrogenase [Candidatus Gottesmanbacteria bacterium]|nr:3-isopropylmalate dehydrogenase [Candidatus Gottesmanbacteria bacterium]
MKKNIAVLPGDGIGPEVTQQAVNVLKAIAGRFKHSLHFVYGSIGGEAIDRYGNPLPPETLSSVNTSNAVLLGAVGGPKWDYVPVANGPDQGVLMIRKLLRVFANLRPVKTYTSLSSLSVLKQEIVKDTDILFVRELTGGIYFNSPRGRRDKGNSAIDTSKYSKEEISRIATVAFNHALKRRKKVTSVDKANALETSRLWRETVVEMGKKFPTVQLEHLYVDNAAMQLIKNPKQFDVILTENMFGDILTDEAAVLSASIGLLPSASIGNTHPYLYEPIHGSAPKYAGQNKVNPIGAILSAAMMLRISFKLEKEADTLEKAVEKVLQSGYRTKDITTEKTPKNKILGTKEIGDKICEELK